ncbi:LPS export ABC transporter periplasmic protein LptC [Propionivibrio soli]|uniref:LPS export ABC transporter periplasmic protein LptC n=1 Tax=Propionivibrio soli TaxID=2976531 RepID=UPI0021E7A6E1|nr:LPS export ABC transporter periplasmic protein LptC [Propionivibrio soli]
MRNWGSALFPLSLLLALAALTFWLRYATELPEERRDGKTRHDPDYVITGATLRKLDPTGQLQYTLKATDIRHYPDDDTTDLTKPDLEYLRPKKPPTRITAERAHMDKTGRQVDLYENVKVRREPDGKYDVMTATTNTLTVLPDEDRAFTKDPVLITEGGSWVKGIGMQLNTSTQIYILESHAFAMLESRHAKKSKP